MRILQLWCYLRAVCTRTLRHEGIKLAVQQSDKLMSGNALLDSLSSYQLLVIAHPLKQLFKSRKGNLVFGWGGNSKSRIGGNLLPAVGINIPFWVHMGMPAILICKSSSKSRVDCAGDACDGDAEFVRSSGVREILAPRFVSVKSWFISDTCIHCSL